MKVTIYNKGTLYANCPSCQNKTDIEYLDFVEKHPMIWCWNCMCGESKFVIDSSLEDIEQMEEDTIKTFDLLLIKRIASVSDMYKFVDSYNKKNNTSFSETPDVQRHMKVSDDEFIKKILDEVGVELNSYNIKDIRQTYPDYDLSHGSCYMCIEVIEKNGDLTQMTFWGC